MSATILERDMLKTRVPERGLAVTTFLHQEPCRCGPPCAPWAGVWSGEHVQRVWLHFWQGPTTPGGLAQAHERVVEQVRRGEIPVQAQHEEARRMSSWRARQSEVVGGGTAHSGSVYRALVPLVCDGCGARVAPGDEFTRSSRGPTRAALHSGWLRIVCAACGHKGPPGTGGPARGG